MKKMICAILVVVLIVGMIPITAFAAGNTYIEVTKDQAAVRTKADGDAKIALRLEEGVVLESVATHYNWKKLSNWYEIRIPGKEGTYFIFAGNVKIHEHETTSITVNDIVYKICNCGNIRAETTTAEQNEEASLVLGSATLALPLVDGPLPLGDLAAAAVVIVLLRRGQIHMGDKVNFCVPTGNFGDILAGYLAKKLGLPVGMLVCASNANNVLTDFIRTGTYDRRRPLHKTISPSMDILVSSNLERLLYFMSDGNTELVADLMGQLNKEGVYTVPEELKQAIGAEFWAGCCDDQQASKTIAKVFAEQGYLCDTHTATGWAVAEDYVNQTGDNRPMVVLSTASPYKFPAAVLASLEKAESEDEFMQMEQLEKTSGVPIPGNLAGLQNKKELHTGVIEKDRMLQFVMEL